jgi:hypothetical protein
MPAAAGHRLSKHRLDLNGIKPLEDIPHGCVGRCTLPIQAERIVELAAINIDEDDNAAV